MTTPRRMSPFEGYAVELSGRLSAVQTLHRPILFDGGFICAARCSFEIVPGELLLEVWPCPTWQATSVVPRDSQ